ncbi:MAG: hypothetical protein NPIRA02_36370 [Nitrospirales bacterium]|nr:MAG: hypothetical protein NPIRA02_36370 [Nitrospirales bacterium]
MNYRLGLNPHYIVFVVCVVIKSVAYGQGIIWAEEVRAPVETVSGTQVMTMTMESYSFTPNVLVGDVGQPIEFLLKNESFLVPHNFLLDSPDGVRLIEANVDSGEEATIRFTPTQSGVHDFYCDKQLLFFPDHHEEGMEGTLTVR